MTKIGVQNNIEMPPALGASHKNKAEDIATEKSVALKGHKYVIDTVGVTKSHRLVVDTAGVTKSHTLVIDTAHAGKGQVC